MKNIKLTCSSSSGASSAAATSVGAALSVAAATSVGAVFAVAAGCTGWTEVAPSESLLFLLELSREMLRNKSIKKH